MTYEKNEQTAVWLSLDFDESKENSAQAEAAAINGFWNIQRHTKKPKEWADICLQLADLLHNLLPKWSSHIMQSWFRFQEYIRTGIDYIAKSIAVKYLCLESAKRGLQEIRYRGQVQWVHCYLEGNDIFSVVKKLLLEDKRVNLCHIRHNFSLPGRYAHVQANVVFVGADEPLVAALIAPEKFPNLSYPARKLILTTHLYQAIPDARIISLCIKKRTPEDSDLLFRPTNPLYDSQVSQLTASKLRTMLLSAEDHVSKSSIISAESLLNILSEGDSSESMIFKFCKHGFAPPRKKPDIERSHVLAWLMIPYYIMLCWPSTKIKSRHRYEHINDEGMQIIARIHFRAVLFVVSQDEYICSLWRSFYKTFQLKPSNTLKLMLPIMKDLNCQAALISEFEKFIKQLR